MTWICRLKMKMEKQEIEIEIRDMVPNGADMARRRHVRFGVDVKA